MASLDINIASAVAEAGILIPCKQAIDKSVVQVRPEGRIDLHSSANPTELRQAHRRGRTRKTGRLLSSYSTTTMMEFFNDAWAGVDISVGPAENHKEI
jgi:hypothetical protein